MECDIIIVPYRTLFLHIESTDNTYGIIEVLLLKKDGQVMMADPHQAPYGNSTFQICQLPVPYNPDYTPNRFYEVPGAPLRYSTSPFFRDPPDLASYLVQIYAERRYMISFQQPPHGGFYIYYPVTSHNSKGAFTMIYGYARISAKVQLKGNSLEEQK